jgi:hypothetical protein
MFERKTRSNIPNLGRICEGFSSEGFAIIAVALYYIRCWLKTNRR